MPVRRDQGRGLLIRFLCRFIFDRGWCVLGLNSVLVLIAWMRTLAVAHEPQRIRYLRRRDIRIYIPQPVDQLLKDR
jgi:hypothetical protein